MANVPLLKKRVSNEEYGRVKDLLECRELDIKYYTDVPGPAPMSFADPAVDLVGNGDLPPEWGADLTVRDGTLHYGPWTDRQRSQIQEFFFPTSYRHYQKTEPIAPGDLRISTSFNLLLSFEGNTKIRTPFRESSKDWKYLGDFAGEEEPNANIKIGAMGRPYGWTDIKFSGAKIELIIPSTIGEDGYTNLLNVEANNVVLSTSVNRAPVLSADLFKTAAVDIHPPHLQLKGHLDTPRKWNAARTWTFDTTVTKSKIFLLRDHIFLLTDLIKDFTAGPTLSLDYFIPMEYKLGVTLNDFELYLCVNHGNVIGLANDLNENAYLIVGGAKAEGNIVLPFLNYEPASTDIRYEAELTKSHVSMSFPPSTTMGAHLTDVSKDVGTVEAISATGSYRYFSAVHPDNLDSFTIDLKISSVVAKVFGFFISYIIQLKENYAGESTAFATTEEYRNRMAEPAKADEARRKKEAAQPKQNPFEIYLCAIVEDGTLILPSNLYDTGEVCVLTVTLGPINWTLMNLAVHGLDKIKPSAQRFNSLFIHDLSIRGHRLFGPMPRALCYAVDWRVDLGPIQGELQPSFLPVATSMLKSLAFHFLDQDNAIPPPPVLPDITCVQVTYGRVDVSVWGQGSVSSFVLDEGLRLQLDNVVCDRWKSRVFIEIPHILLRSLAATGDSGASDDKSGDPVWVEVLNVRTALSVCIYDREPDWETAKAAQLNFVRTQDMETGRCAFFYEDEGGLSAESAGTQKEDRKPPGWMNWAPPMFSPPFQIMPNHRSNATGGPYEGRKDSWNRRDEFSDDGRKWTKEPDFGTYHTASESESAAGFDDLSGDGQTDEESAPSRPPPPVPRSIPYRSYLKRFKMSRPKTNTPAFLHAHVRPPMTQFTLLNNRGYDDMGYAETDEEYGERPFRSLAKMDSRLRGPPLQRDNESRTLITIDASKPIEMLLTPIYLKIVQEFLENLAEREMNLESIIDSVQLDYMEEIMRVFKYRYSATSLLFSTPKMHIQSIQDMMLPDAATFLNDETNMGIRTRYELSDAVLCSFDIIVAQVVARVFWNMENPNVTMRESKLVEAKLHLDVDSIKMNLRFMGHLNDAGIVGIPSSKHHFNDPKERYFEQLDGVPIVLDIYSEKIRWHGYMDRRSLAPDVEIDESNCGSMSFEMKELSVASINQTIEIMFGALLTWLNFGADVGRMVGLFTTHRRKVLQQLIAGIADTARKTRVEGDRTFLTQPLSVWLLEPLPQHQDTGWKVLSHIRHCFRMLTPDAVAQIRGSLAVADETNPRQLYETVLRYFATWRQWEVTDLASTRLLLNIFQQKRTSSDRRSTNSGQEGPKAEDLLFLLNNKVAVNISRFSLTVFEFQRDDNSVMVGPLFMEVRSLPQDRELLEVVRNPKGDKSSGGNDSTADGDSKDRASSNLSRDTLAGKFVDIVFRLKVGRMDVKIDPNIFGFVRHVLRVNRWFQDNIGGKKNQPMVAAPTLEPERPDFALADLQYTVSAAVIVDTIAVTAVAHNLMARVKLQGLQTSHINIGKQLQEIQEAYRQSSKPADFTPAMEQLLHTSMGSIVSIKLTICEGSFGRHATPATTLVSVKVGGISGSLSISQRLSAGNTKPKLEAPQKLSVAAVVRSFSIQMPRSFLKVQAFIEKWGDEDLPRYDFLFNKLVKEWESTQTPGIESNESSETKSGRGSTNTAAAESPLFGNLSLQLMLTHLSIESDLLATLRFFYDAHDLVVGVEQEHLVSKTDGSVPREIKTDYSARLARHEIKFLARNPERSTAVPQWTTFAMPTVISQGTILQPYFAAVPKGSAGSLSLPPIRVEATLALDVIETTVTVSIIDQLITTQSVLGGELNDIVDIFAFHSRKRSGKGKVPSTEEGKPKPEKQALFYALKITVQGISIAAEGPTSAILFESNVLDGFLMNFPREGLSSGSWNGDIGKKDAKLLWRFAASRFCLSLVPMLENNQSYLSNAKVKLHPLAYVVVEFALQNYRGKLDSTKTKASPPRASVSSRLGRSGAESLSSLPTVADTLEEKLEMFFIRFYKIHAVARPTAFGRMADIMFYYRNELERRKQMKAKEIATIKENAQRFLKGVNVPLPEYKKDASFFHDKMLVMKLTHIGAAIPLTEAEEGLGSYSESETMSNTSTGRGGSETVPAFLISARSINFVTKRFATASGHMRDFAIQFVPAFDQTDERSFAPSAHVLQNRVLLQDINADINQTSVGARTMVSIAAGIKGFVLEVDANITEYINRLNAIYERGRENVFSFIPDYPRPEEEKRTDPGIETTVIADAEPPDTGSEVPSTRLEIDGRFEFETGTCKIWNSTRRRPSVARSATGSGTNRLGSRREPPRDGISEGQDVPEEFAHILALPGITLLTTGKTIIGESSTLHMEPPSAEAFKKAFHIELVIHPSDNIVHPSILLFYHQVMMNLKVGRKLKQKEAEEEIMNLREQENSATSNATPATTNVPRALSAYERHNITFYLRLSQTKVSLSCQPVSKVICALNLDEADFLFSFVPKGDVIDDRQFISCTANVMGMSGSLRHAFSPEDCLRGEIPRLSFNATMVEEAFNRTYAVQVGLPSVLSSLNVRHLQDFFLFERMWFGNAATDPGGGGEGGMQRSQGLGDFSTQKASKSLLQLSRVALEQASDYRDSLRVAIRLNRVDFSADLGQSIGKVVLTLEDMVGSVTTTWNSVAVEERTLSLAINALNLKGEGRFSGATSVVGVRALVNAQNPLLSSDPNASKRGTEVSIQVDKLASQLQYQYERILILEMFPISGGFVDRWDEGSGVGDVGLDIDFTIDSLKLIVSRRTVPTFLHMLNRLKALIDEKRGTDVPAGKGGESLEVAHNTLGLVPMARPAKDKRAADIGSPTISPTSSTHANLRSFWTLGGINANVSGRIRLILGDAFVALTRYNFRDPDCAHIVAKRCEMTFDQRPTDRSNAVEATLLNLGGFSVRKCSAKAISQTEERMWTTAQWFAFMTSSAAKNVVVVPPVTVHLETDTKVAERTVEYSFQTEFSGKIDIALNFGLYKYLKELVDLYEKAVIGAGEADADDKGKAVVGSS
ncbi:hypothetical protein HK104_008423, partial [Borealophlyctis nickersoniae]